MHCLHVNSTRPVSGIPTFIVFVVLLISFLLLQFIFMPSEAGLPRQITEFGAAYAGEVELSSQCKERLKKLQQPQSRFWHLTQRNPRTDCVYVFSFNLGSPELKICSSNPL